MFESIFKDTMAEVRWTDIEKASERGVPVLFPIGVIEEHGPHLPLGSDIYWSSALCRLVKKQLKESGKDSLIAPPYYWGINHCTGIFPGSFSLKKDTMKLVLLDIFENLKNFHLNEIYCFNYHGDGEHVTTIVDAIKTANEKFDMRIRMVLESMNLEMFGWTGEEDFLFVVSPEYPMELFEEEEPSERGLLDIHAGAYETAAMDYFCKELVDTDLAKQLKSYSLTNEGMQNWLQGGNVMKNTVPLGYAGNPCGYEAVSKNIELIIGLQVKAIAGKIAEVMKTEEK